jgi:hypothetical protein
MGWTRLLIPFACISLTLAAAGYGGTQAEQTENRTGLFGHHPNFILCETRRLSCTFY